jgi:predicted nucleic acid-binding protein
LTVLVDTSVLIDHLRGDERAVELLERLFTDESRIWAATPTRTEILAGVTEAERTPTEGLLALLAWVDIDVAIADEAGELARRYRRSHPGIDTVDYLIAAAAGRVGARLLTLNVRHFPMFEALQPAYR